MNIEDLQDHHVLQHNREKSRAHFIPFNNEEDALTENRSQSEQFQLLNGRWKFHYAASPQESPVYFQKDYVSDTNWEEIQVPGHWQLQGYGVPHYTNVSYPFSVETPYIPTENPTGTYYREFIIPENWQGESIYLRFEGVDNSFHLLVNGEEVGFSKGSRIPAEFDITSYLKSGPNNLTVVVYKWSDSTYWKIKICGG